MRPDASVHCANAYSRLASWRAAISSPRPIVSTLHVIAVGQEAQPLLVYSGSWLAKMEVKSVGEAVTAGAAATTGVAATTGAAGAGPSPSW